MHIKSLTLRGFKSFASATECSFSPAINVIVGPNGSGKSNIVDALAWVMGQQGAKSLRGEKMQDVVFAGTSTHAALGRAKVTLTLDNSEGLLGIPSEEVTIERTMFRSGGSEYALNGQAVRLSDIQELLADAGVAQGDHALVGQGRVDEILTANAEQRRDILEEAFGIHRFRQRASKSERKLESMKQNLHRLEDLNAELTSQLEPLRLQAESARAAGNIQQQIHQVSGQLFRREAEQMAEKIQQIQLRVDQAQNQKADAEKHQLATQQRLDQLINQDQSVREEQEQLQKREYRIHTVFASVQASLTLIEEKQRALKTETPVQVEEVQDVIQQIAGETEAISSWKEKISSLTEHQKNLMTRRSQLAEQLQQIRSEQQRQQEISELAREQRSTLLSQLAAQRARVEKIESDLENFVQEEQEAHEYLQGIQERLAQLESNLTEQSAQRDELQTLLTKKQEKRRSLAQEIENATQSLHDVENRAAALCSQRAIFEEALVHLENSTDEAGSHQGSSPQYFADSLTVEKDWQLAVSAALHNITSAKVLDHSADLEIATEEHSRPRPQVFPPVNISEKNLASTSALPHGAVRAESVIKTATDLTQAIVQQALRDVVLLEKLDNTQELLAQYPTLTFYDRAGNALNSYGYVPHQASLSNPLELTAKIEALTADIEQTREENTSATRTLKTLSATLEENRQSEKELAREIGVLSAQSADIESQKIAALTTAEVAQKNTVRRSTQMSQARQQRDKLRELWKATEDALDRAENQPNEKSDLSEQASDIEKDLQEIAIELSVADTELHHAQERRELAEGKRTQLKAHLQSLEKAQQRAQQLHDAATRHGKKFSLLTAQFSMLARTLENELATTQTRRQELEQKRESLRIERGNLSENLGHKQKALLEVQTEVDRTTRDLLKAELIQQNLQEKIEQELKIDSSLLSEKFDVSEKSKEELLQDRSRLLAQQEKLGVVNPLAVEEFDALQERQTYLEQQIQDLKKSRADMRSLLKDLNNHIKEQFLESFELAAEQFAEIFAELFDGGEGALVLTDPQDVLSSGIEIQARPADKKIKRLSLLSGGERTLASLAFLAALFAVRPAPFYVLDEVEAALDDRNLTRVHRLFERLAQQSQLIIVTHKPRTVELGDSLVGISMQDGVSLVLSQDAEQIRALI